MSKHWPIILILLLAAGLRLYGLERGDTLNDEVFYGFRAIGLLDFDKAATQKTPLEWWDGNIPWWTKLSFHDHPPLVFWIQHIFMNVFGDNAFAMRLPSALLGIASVYLIYLIGLRLFSPPAALISSVFLAITLNHVYISRAGMQEAYVIFFMLLAVYFFLRALESDQYLIWTGVALGLGFVTKYNVFILVPVFLIYLALYKREYLKNKKLWLGVLFSILIFSPVIIYNIMLYASRGHFDFQVSHIIGQVPAGGEEAPGKEIGTLIDRVKNFLPRVIASSSWLFLALFTVSVLFLRNAFLFLVFGFLVLLLLFIGPSYRFLTMLTPWMALSIGSAAEHYFFAFLAAAKQSSGLLVGKTRSKTMLGGLIFAILLFEIFYSYNNQIAYYPAGPTPWLASKVRYENYNWGYNDLEKYLLREFEGKMPALTFNNRYQFLDDAQDHALERARAQNLEAYHALTVYYGNFDEGARLWIFDRLNVYHAWPIITFDTYLQYLRERGRNYYQKVGYKNYYFILALNIVPSPEFNEVVKNQKPIIITNRRGDAVFKIYKF